MNNGRMAIANMLMTVYQDGANGGPYTGSQYAERVDELYATILEDVRNEVSVEQSQDRFRALEACEAKVMELRAGLREALDGWYLSQNDIWCPGCLRAPDAGDAHKEGCRYEALCEFAGAKR